MTKKILFINDIHAGHLGGLTHPDFMTSVEAWRGPEKAGWDMYKGFLEAHGPFHQVVSVGDLIDGPGNKNNGRHLITTDMRDQCKMAEAVLRAIPTEKSSNSPFIFVRGTEYHTDRFCSFEDFIADSFDAPIHNHVYHVVDSCVIDVKHKASTAASSLRSVMDNAMKWHELHGYPRPNVIVRGHIHQFQRYEVNGSTVITLPGAQMFSDYGERNVERMIDFGFCCLHVEDGRFQGKLDVELAQLAACGQEAITRG